MRAPSGEPAPVGVVAALQSGCRSPEAGGGAHVLYRGRVTQWLSIPQPLPLPPVAFSERCRPRGRAARTSGRGGQVRVRLRPAAALGGLMPRTAQWNLGRLPVHLVPSILTALDDLTPFKMRAVLTCRACLTH